MKNIGNFYDLYIICNIYLILLKCFFHRFVGRVTDEPSTRIKTGIVTSESNQEMVALLDMAGHEKSTQ